VAEPNLSDAAMCGRIGPLPVCNHKKEAILSGTMLATYRLPSANITKIGSVRIVKDRNGKVYADGTKVVSATVVGAHTMLEVADGRTFYVLTSELQRVPKAKGR
jgi:hypothetical protein